MVFSLMDTYLGVGILKNSKTNITQIKKLSHLL